MSQYCTNCGTVVDDNANFCPSCGAALAITDNSGTGAADSQAGSKSGITGSDVLKGAAVVGGAAVGAAALSSLARNLTHRRRPPYMGPRHGGPGGPGHGGPGMW